MFEADGSLAILVLYSVPESVGRLGSSCLCCLRLMDCPPFPLGVLPPGRMTFFFLSGNALHYPIFTASVNLCLLPLVTCAYGPGQKEAECRSAFPLSLPLGRELAREQMKQDSRALADSSGGHRNPGPLEVSSVCPRA